MKSTRIFVGVLAVLMLLGQVVYATGQAENKVVIKYADFHATSTILWQGVERFKELVEKNSNGEIEVQIFPAGQLGGQRELLESVKNGTIQMTYGNSPMLSNYVTEFALLDLPYMFTDYDHIERVVFGDVGLLLNDRLIKKAGIRILNWNQLGFRDMMTREIKIEKLADFKGVKFRSPEAFAYISMFNALGAVPTPLPWTEVYEAMRTRIVDGMETIPEGMTSSKVYEVSKYVILTNHINTVETPVINEVFYQGLSNEHKKIITDSLAEVARWQNQAQIDANKAAYTELEQKGITFIKIDRAPLIKSCEQVWAEFARKVPESELLITMINSLR